MALLIAHVNKLETLRQAHYTCHAGYHTQSHRQTWPDIYMLLPPIVIVPHKNMIGNKWKNTFCQLTEIPQLKSQTLSVCDSDEFHEKQNRNELKCIYGVHEEKQHMATHWRMAPTIMPRIIRTLYTHICIYTNHTYLWGLLMIQKILVSFIKN